MNRQAFTFLTLFTLVLMLAVYYVTLPIDNPELDTNELIVQQEDLIEHYQNELEMKYNESVKEEEKIVSNSESTLQQKLEALNKITETEKIKELEKKILNELALLNYSGCFVEIEDQVTRVICDAQYNSKANAASILSSVYKWIESEKLVEVSFE